MVIVSSVNSDQPGGNNRDCLVLLQRQAVTGAPRTEDSLENSVGLRRWGKHIPIVRTSK